MLKEKLMRRINKVRFGLAYSFLKAIARIHLWSCDNEVVFARAEFEKYVRESGEDDEEVISILMMAFDDVACKI